jgi:hypothetical protein
MEIHVDLRAIEQAVLVRIRLPDAQDIPGRFQRRDVGGLIRGIGDHEHDVDDRLGDEPGDRRGPDVLAAQGTPTKGVTNASFLAREVFRPRGIVLHQGDGAIDAGRLPDGGLPDLLLGERL